MKVNSISNYSLGVSNNYNNKSAKAAPHFTGKQVPTPGVFEYRADSPFANLLMKISARIIAKMNKAPKKAPEVNEKITEMTPEAKKLYDKVQNKCDGKFLFYSREKSPELKQLAEYYKNEEILSARNAKKA